jgi:hypothetical protein
MNKAHHVGELIDIVLRQCAILDVCVFHQIDSDFYCAEVNFCFSSKLHFTLFRSIETKNRDRENGDTRKRGQTMFSTFYRIEVMLKKVVCPHFLRFLAFSRRCLGRISGGHFDGADPWSIGHLPGAGRAGGDCDPARGHGRPGGSLAAALSGCECAGAPVLPLAKVGLGHQPGSACFSETADFDSLVERYRNPEAVRCRFRNRIHYRAFG